jgi:hypothetical protein
MKRNLPPEQIQRKKLAIPKIPSRTITTYSHPKTWTLQERQDPVRMLNAISLNPSAFEFASPSLQKEPSFIRGALIENWWVWQYIDPVFLKDADWVMETMLEHVRMVVKKASGFFLALENKKIHRDILANDKYSLKLMSEFPENIARIILAFLPPELKRNKNFIASVLQQHPYLLQDISNTLKKDPDVVLTALKAGNNSGKILLSADITLQRNIDFIKTVLPLCPDVFRFLKGELLKNRELAIEAVKHDGKQLAFVGKTFQNDLEIVIAAIKQNRAARQWVPTTLKDNPDFIRAITKKHKGLFFLFNPLPVFNSLIENTQLKTEVARLPTVNNIHFNYK